MKVILFIVTGLLAVAFIGIFLILRLPVFGSKPVGAHLQKIKTSHQFNAAQEIFVNRRSDIIKQMNKDALSWRTFMEWFKPDKKRQPSQPLPQVKPDLQEFLRPSNEIKVIWLGHSTFLLNLSGKIILVDPVFSESASPFSFMIKRFQPPALSLDELPNIDLIVISHDHYDHLDMKAIKFFADKDVQFLMPLGVSTHLSHWGIKETNMTELDWWESKTVDTLEFIATPAQHFSGRDFEQNKTLWASWVIRSPLHKIYFSGDSGYDIHFKEIGDKYGPFDVAFIENGQYNPKWQAVHALPEESVQAYFDLRAKIFFPIHWGMFVLSLHSWRDPVDQLLKLSQERGVKIMTPKLGQLVTINDDYRNVEWWLDLK